MKQKLFRDPVHNIIGWNIEDEVEARIFELISSRTVQRLRRIRQLGFAHLVYHGAEHSRFAHSLGVVHVARRILNALEIQDEDLRFEVLAASILHDVGHGPFSHAIEKVTGIHHETYTQRLVLDSDLTRILESVDHKMPERVARYYGPRGDFAPEHQVFLDIVSSQLDADRLDYILRDGLTTGVKIGVYDFERILSMFEIHRDGDQTRLAVNYRAREAVEGYLIARFHMFKQVYLHKTVRSAEKMLEAVLRRAHDLLKDGHEFSAPLEAHLASLLSGSVLDAQDYVWLDDTDIWVALKKWRDDKDPILSELASSLLDRKLFKTIAIDPNDPVFIARMVDRAEQLALKAGLDPRYFVLLDRAQDTPYKPYDPTQVSASHIPIVTPTGVSPIEDVSDIVHLLGRDAYKVLHLCVPAQIKGQLLEFQARIQA